MRNTLSRWIERKLAETYGDYVARVRVLRRHRRRPTHAPLSTGEVVCWHCAEQAGEFGVPTEKEWRIGNAL